jgi:hypothetical protein
MLVSPSPITAEKGKPTQASEPKRTLWLHTGGSKAGSSALQAQFAHLSPLLKQHGIAYLNAQAMTRVDQITSGNGGKLYELLVDKPRSPAEITEGLDRYFDCTAGALCSSEILSHLEPEHLTLLADAARSSGTALKFIFVARNPLPYFISEYGQRIKRHGECRTFSEFLLDESNHYQHAVHLRNLVARFPLNEIFLLHYDALKSSLVQAVLSLLIADPSQLSGLSELSSGRIVNRSLTWFEMEIMLDLNAKLPTELTAKLSDALIYDHPSLKSEFPISEWIIDGIRQRCSKDVDWINETFAERDIHLELPSPKGSGELGDGANLPPSDEAKSAACIIAGLTRLWNPAGTEFADVTMPSLLPIILSLCEISTAFSESLVDAEWYLSRYPDVKKAGLEPTEHYFKWGVQEYRSPRPDVARFVQRFIREKLRPRF